MGLNFTHKYWWKNLIHKMYSWGASIVLVGALFKITHWPGATIMLTVGLLTEAVIFFFSGIEPPHEEIDWTLVYPELKVSEDIEDDILSSGDRGKKTKGEVQVPQTEAINQFNEMLEKAGEEGLFEKLNTGLNKFNDNVVKMGDITDASVATNEFSENVKNASGNVNQLSETYKKSAVDINSASSELNSSVKQTAENLTNQVGSASSELSESVKQSAQNLNYATDGLSDAFNKTQEEVNSHKDELNNSYENLISSMDLDFSSISDGNKEYNERISGLNKNLTAVNAIFEMQLGEANLEEMVKDVQESAVYAKKYSEEITRLSKNLNALNGVYGKMLSAMNAQVD